tara:strand:- start:22394 stop:22759 length:366 start_codon:yes stop_codon:yes gene_type:complete
LKLIVEQNYEFIPEFRNNKQELEPIKIKLRQLTTSERQRLMAIDPVKIALSNESGNKLDLNVDYEGLFRSAVIEIFNLDVNGKSISTPIEFLASPGLGDLLIEVCMNIVQQNSRNENEIKK